MRTLKTKEWDTDEIPRLKESEFWQCFEAGYRASVPGCVSAFFTPLNPKIASVSLFKEAEAMIADLSSDGNDSSSLFG